MDQKNLDRCQRLSRLRQSLLDEMSHLREAQAEEEKEGVANPVELVDIMKHLQETLQRVELELQKCP